MKNAFTVTYIILANSLNYGEGIGNISSLKKLSRANGEMYSYASRQAFRYNIVEQMGTDTTPIVAEGSGDKTVLQFHPDATITDYPEIDLFGYMKTKRKEEGHTRTRPAAVRINHVVSLEPYLGDIDFLTNKGLADRFNIQQNKKEAGSNIAQSEVQESFYEVTLSVDLDKIGEDIADNISLDNEEKYKRVCALLDTIKFLFRDIKGRRENLSPLFIVGGVYERKNPFFFRRLSMNKNKLDIRMIQDTIEIDDLVKNHTKIGYVTGSLANNDEIVETLQPLSIKDFFEHIKEECKEVYHVE